MSAQDPQTESAKVGWMMVAILLVSIAMALLALCHTGWRPFDLFILCQRRAQAIYVSVLSWTFAGGALYLGLHKLGDVRLNSRLYLGMFLIAVFLCAYDTQDPNRWLIFEPRAALDFAAPSVFGYVVGTLVRWMIHVVRSTHQH